MSLNVIHPENSCVQTKQHRFCEYLIEHRISKRKLHENYVEFNENLRETNEIKQIFDDFND
jgi:uncharacterized protein YktA (UPF0223 family)